MKTAQRKLIRYVYSHFQSEMTNSSSKLYPGLRQPSSIFKTPKTILILPYFWTWCRSTISSVTLRKPTLCSRNAWICQCNWGHHIVKHVLKFVRMVQSWRNVVSARSHDTVVEPIVYKHGRKGCYVTKSCAHCWSVGVRFRRVKVSLLLRYAMNSSMTFSNVSLLPSRSDQMLEPIFPQPPVCTALLCIAWDGITLDRFGWSRTSGGEGMYQDPTLIRCYILLQPLWYAEKVGRGS